MKDVIKHLKSLSVQQILSGRPGDWGDFELLDVLKHFMDRKEFRQAAAILTLILRAPEHGEMVAYNDLYLDLVERERAERNYAAALRWGHAAIAYLEQHEAGANRDFWQRELAETYLRAGDLDTGLAMMSRCLKADPADIWTYNILGLSLPHVGLSELAVETIDQALKLVAKDDSVGLKSQLEDMHEKAVKKAAGEQSRLQAVDPAVLVDFRAALQGLAAYLGGQKAYQPPLDQLLTTDKPEALSAEITAQGKVLAPELIRLAFDEKLRLPVRQRAVALLRQLQADKVAELAELKPWLDRAEGNWPVELLTRRMGKIGGYTTAELKAIAADTRYHQYTRTSASEALVERAQKCPAQREEVVNFMRTLLTRPEASELADEETFIGFLAGDIADLDARELYPEIEAAFQEDRVDTTITDLAFIQEKLNLPVSPIPKRRGDGLYLPLRCLNCGRVREYFVQHVTVDAGTEKRKAAGQAVKYHSHVMDREIICPKCGAREQYELTPQANLRLLISTSGLESFTALLRGGKGEPKFKPHPNVHYFESLILGHPMHPLEGLDKYRELIAANPKDVALRMRMGNILRTLHRYPQALEAFRQGYQLGTDDPEYVLIRAMAEHDFGDREFAKALYEETVTLASKQLLHNPSYTVTLVQTAQQGLKSLKRGKGSPWQPDVVSGGNKLPQQALPSGLPKKQSRAKAKKKKNKRKK